MCSGCIPCALTTGSLCLTAHTPTNMFQNHIKGILIHHASALHDSSLSSPRLALSSLGLVQLPGSDCTWQQRRSLPRLMARRVIPVHVPIPATDRTLRASSRARRVMFLRLVTNSAVMLRRPDAGQHFLHEQDPPPARRLALKPSLPHRPPPSLARRGEEEYQTGRRT